MARDVVLVAGRRSPFGRYLGALSGIDPLDLAVQVSRAALAAAGPGVGADAVDAIYVGNCFPTAFATGSVVGRQLGLALGTAAPALSVDTACCSSLTALRLAAEAVGEGRSEVALVVGVDVMSRIPHLARGLRTGVRAGPVSLEDPVFPIEYKGYAPVAVDGQRGADRHGVTREDMDRWAVESQRRYAAALAEHGFADEICPVSVREGKGVRTVAADEQPRPETTYEKLAVLPGVFGTASITAGNAPGLNDGAVAALVTSQQAAARLGAGRLARIAAAAAVTDAPDGIAWVPASAVRAVLGRAGRKLGDVSLVEINEAFAAMPLVSTKLLAASEGVDLAWLRERTNAQGGAIAVGHPVAASGLRLALTLAGALRRGGGGRGVAAICGGLSQGEAVLLEV